MIEASLPRPLPRPVLRRPGLDRLAFQLSVGLVFLSACTVFRLPGVFFTVSDILTLAAFVVLLAAGRVPGAPLGQLTPFWYASFLAIAGGMALGSAVNERLASGATVFLQYGFAMLILPAVLGSWDHAQTRRLLLVWVVSIVVIMIHGVWLMNFAEHPSMDMVSGSRRLRGLLERETELGAIGAMAILVTMYLTAERLLRLPVALAFVLILLYGMVLTASNTGIMALAAGVVPFTLLQKSRRHFWLLGLLVAVAVLAILIAGDGLFTATFTRRVAGALESGDLSQAGTFEGRMDLIREGWRISADHVLVGLGADGFRQVSVEGQPVHNTYVLLLVEGGVLSLAGVCLMVAALGIWGAGHLRRDRNAGALLIAMAILYGVALSAFPHIYARFYFVPLVLVAVLAATLPHRPRPTGSLAQRR